MYWIGTGYYLRRSFVYLRTKPYNQMRMANQHLRINVRLTHTRVEALAVQAPGKFHHSEAVSSGLSTLSFAGGADVDNEMTAVLHACYIVRVQSACLTCLAAATTDAAGRAGSGVFRAVPSALLLRQLRQLPLLPPVLCALLLELIESPTSLTADQMISRSWSSTERFASSTMAQHELAGSYRDDDLCTM